MYAEKLSSPNAREAHEEGTGKRLYQSSLLAAVSALNEQRAQKSCQYNKLHSRESFNASCDQEAIQPSNSGIVINRHSLCPPPWKLLLSSQFLLSMHPLLGAVWAEGKVGIRGWRRLEKHHRKYNYVHKYIQIDRIQNRMHFNVQCHSWRLSSPSHLLMTTIAWR